MPAYILSTMTIHDPATYRRYTDVTPPIVKRHGGKFLTRGDPVTTAEGEAFTGRLVIIEFPDRAHAEAFYADPDYQAASKHRRAGARDCRLIIQESRDNTLNPDPMLEKSCRANLLPRPKSGVPDFVEIGATPNIGVAGEGVRGADG